MQKEKIVEYFMGAIHCSQVVAGEMAERFGVDRDMLMSMAAPLGGGCFNGEVCGCVTGGLLCIGLSCGHCHKGDVETNARMVEMTKEFENRFAEENGSLRCKDLCGYDFSAEGELEKAMESGVLFETCPKLVNSALDILDDII